jgi:predicted DNA-binding protein YlxM (UPF0122 family)
MAELAIKADNFDAVKSEIISAFNTQKRIIKTSIQRTLSNIHGFEKKYDFTTDELLKQERNGTLNDDNLEFIEWIGETKMLKWLEEELELLEQINIC